MEYTQRQLAREWNRRTKSQKANHLKQINIYKLEDGTYTQYDPSKKTDFMEYIGIILILSVIVLTFWYWPKG